MFVGHGLIAFALVAALAHVLGYEPERALSAGVFAGLFATAPDVDIVYGPVGLVGGVSGVSAALDAFWSTGNVVHRGPTHSLLVGAVAAIGFGGVASGRGSVRWVAAGVLAGLVALTTVVSGFVGGLVVLAFVGVGAVLVGFARREGFSPREIGAIALAGLCTHPFGDLFTGAPPALLYPLDVTLVSERVVLHPDPTLHLLAAFGLEIVAAWLALALTLHLSGYRLWNQIDRRAGLGAGYGAAALALPAPTLDASYHFVFSVLAFGAAGVASPSLPRIDWVRTATTGLATVTLAALAYLLVYLHV